MPRFCSASVPSPLLGIPIVSSFVVSGLSSPDQLVRDTVTPLVRQFQEHGRFHLSAWTPTPEIGLIILVPVFLKLERR